MSTCFCCYNYTTPSTYTAYDNFCDPFRYSGAVDGKYINFNKHSCRHCGNCGKNKKPGKPDKDKKVRFSTTWSGHWPYPYRGHWTLYKNGKDISYMIPTDRRIRPMYTFGEYPVYYLYPGFPVVSYVQDGFKAAEWIRYNFYWISMISESDEDLLSLYLAFHANDWRFAPMAPPCPYIPPGDSYPSEGNINDQQQGD